MTRKEIKTLDKLYSIKVKSLAGYACQYCHRHQDTVWLNACHIIGRRNRTLRWDLENGISLCYSHHIAYDHHLPQHEDIRAMIGEKRIQRLIEKAREIKKTQDFEEIKSTLL